MNEPARTRSCPSAGFPILSGVFEVHIECSGQDCAEELEIVVDELDELDGLSCDCGHGFVLLSLGEVELISPATADVIVLRDDDLRLAA